MAKNENESYFAVSLLFRIIVYINYVYPFFIHISITFSFSMHRANSIPYLK